MSTTPGVLVARGRRQASALREMYRRGRRRRAWVRERHAQSPPLREALAGDLVATLRYRGEERPLSRSEMVAEAVRLSWVSDAFFAQVLYRGRVAALRRGIPVVPRLCHLGAMTLSQVCIGDPVVIKAGLYLPHGQVVVDGITEVGPGAILFPWTTIGLRAGNFTGPRLGSGVHVGTGAKIVGPVSVGSGARLGANTVVIDDVPGGSTVVGVPARVAGAART
ncbi:MAG: hypothetical protein U0R27_13040 [Candidatus Nanopelagicales bacterium]|nr:hypothetical protein [Actinomycetota bacterium]HNE87742.1 hypothetical protein [Actinomycetota bacterium]HNL50330.1 hypothetical protein [Actinomycetota bacterium]HNO14595.1 hypothetical protein [Actinomycetota bacterium]HUM85756.1 hypothetical protein [Actinomycetota bacterium]